MKNLPDCVYYTCLFKSIKDNKNKNRNTNKKRYVKLMT